MTAVGWLVRRQFRRRWAALLPVACVVALGATAAFTAAGAADRTAGAYGEFLERSAVGDVLVNPSLNTADIDREIRGLPGVRSVAADVMFFAGLDPEGRPRAAAELAADSQMTQVWGSPDGRYLDVDRPALTEGRLPTGLHEALVNTELAEARGVELGDTLPVSFWGRPEGRDDHPDFVEDPATVFPPLGYEQLTVVGIGTLADEVLPDGLYPRQRIVVSPAMAARYDCLPPEPPVDASVEEVFTEVVVEGCASSYRYYSLDMAAGPAGVDAAMDEFLRITAGRNPRLAPALAEVGASYFLIATTTAQERERVERSIQPTVAALGVLAGVGGVVTVVVAGLAVARELRQSEPDMAQWRQLGLTTGERAGAGAVPLLAAVGTGLVVAAVAAWLLSPVGPVGSVRSIEPAPDRELSPWVLAGLVAAVVVSGAGTVLLAWGAARRSGRPAGSRGSGRPSALHELVRRSARPEVAEGIRAARSGYRGAGLVTASGGVAAATFLAAVVFGASLTAVVSTPAAYGWPWDVATMSGFGYGPVELGGRHGVVETLERRDDVESWTALGFTNAIAVEGTPVLAVIGLEQVSTVDLPLAEGRLPRAADEVALGSLTAADLDVGVGDRVALEGADIVADGATVTGLVVLPPLGPFVADRTAPGTGMLVSQELMSDEMLDQTAAFVGIRLDPSADRDAVFADLRDDFLAWEGNGWPTFDYLDPVRPPEIVDADRMRSVPLLAGVLLVAAAVIGLSLAVVVSVRSRRRELAILRALGFTGRQLRTSVRVQALATMAVALVVGVPVGVALGRLAWRAFASQLGVAAGPVVPVWVLAATVVGGCVVALLAAALPARTASRVDPATVLRSE